MLIATGQTMTAQRYDVESQASGGFIVVNKIALFGGNDVVAVGSRNTFGEQALVFRMNGTTILWSKLLGDSTVSFYSSRLDAVTTSANGDILVAGDENTTGQWRGFIARLDGDGTLLWSTLVATDAEGVWFNELRELADGSIYAVGRVWTGLQRNECVARFTPAGDLLWLRDLDYPGSQYAYYTALEMDTLVVLGSTTLGVGARDISIFRFAPDGTLLSFRTFGTGNNEWPSALLKDGSGGYVITYGINSTQGGILRTDAYLSPIGNPLIISSPYWLNPSAGALWDATSEECILFGQAANATDGFSMAVRISLPGASVVWERTLPGTGFIDHAIATNPTNEGVVMCTANGFNANASYPAHVFMIDLTTGMDMSGVPCMASTPLDLAVTSGSVFVTDHVITNRLRSAVVSHGSPILDYPLKVTPCNSTTLPVELLDWQAMVEIGFVELQWSTGSEVESDRFIVERSIDSERWEPIGVVTARGTSAVRTDYEWKDQAPARGTNYYRLRQLDQDGGSTLSQVRTVEWITSGPLPLVSPNPASPGQMVSAITEVHLYDLRGRELSGPLNSFEAPIQPGMYLVRASGRCEKFLVR
ncbi:MAG: hypothetical protein ABI432_09310 [Flavobacteriales bacterium]